MKLKYFIGAIVIMVIFSGIWVFVETLLYDAPETRVVDDIILLIMFPCFYITSVWLDEKTTKSNDKMMKTEVLDEGD